MQLNEAILSCVVRDEAWISRLYKLRVGTTTRDGDASPHEKPHKPLLLLAALDLIDEGLASPAWMRKHPYRKTQPYGQMRKDWSGGFVTWLPDHTHAYI